MNEPRRLPPAPDLQELIARYGNRGLSAVPEAELIKHERACEEYRAKMREGSLAR